MNALKKALISQFRNPRGPLGRLAGWIMAHRASNRRRNAELVALMALTPGAHVLEFGCGPGLALEGCAQAVPAGKVVGIDHSAEMLAQAEARLKTAGLSGRVCLMRGGEELLDALGAESVDRAYSANVAQFLPAPLRHAKALHRLLAPGGAAFLGWQPRLSDDAADAAEQWARLWTEAMLEAGFPRVARHPFGAAEDFGICLVAVKPGGELGGEPGEA